MLTIKPPISLKCQMGLTALHQDMDEKIRSNYSLMNDSIRREELLYLTTSTPDMYFSEGNNTNVLNEINNRTRQEFRLEVINNLINRIMVSNTENFNYQDSVYISTVLRKIGITDVNSFMKQVSQLQNETRQTNRLINIYEDNRQLLTNLFEQNRKQQKEEGKKSREPETAENRYYLHEKIYERLNTGRIYQEVTNYANASARTEEYITQNQMNVAEQTMQARIFKLQNLKNDVFKTEAPVNFYHSNTYELADTEEKTVAQQDEKLTPAILLNLVDQAYSIKSESIVKDSHKWYNIASSLYESARNTIQRFDSYRREGIFNSTQLQEAIVNINEQRKSEVNALTQITNEFSDVSFAIKKYENNSSVSFEEVIRRYEKTEDILNRTANIENNYQNTETSYSSIRNNEYNYADNSTLKRNEEFINEGNVSEADIDLLSQTIRNEDESRTVINDLHNIHEDRQDVDSRSYDTSINTDNSSVLNENIINNADNRRYDIDNYGYRPVYDENNYSQIYNTQNENIETDITYLSENPADDENLSPEERARLIEERLQKISSVNEEKYRKIQEIENRKLKIRDITVDKAKARENLLRALENPEEVIEEIVKNSGDSVTKQYNRQITNELYENFSEEAKAVYNQVLNTPGRTEAKNIIENIMNINDESDKAPERENVSVEEKPVSREQIWMPSDDVSRPYEDGRGAGYGAEQKFRPENLQHVSEEGQPLPEENISSQVYNYTEETNNYRAGQRTDETNVFRQEFIDNGVTYKDYIGLYLARTEEQQADEQVKSMERAMPVLIRDYLRSEITENNTVQKLVDNVLLTNIDQYNLNSINRNNSLFQPHTEVSVTNEQIAELQREINTEINNTADTFTRETLTERTEENTKATEYFGSSERKIVENNLLEKLERTMEPGTEYTETILQTEGEAGQITERVTLDHVTDRVEESTRTEEYSTSSERQILENNLLEKLERTAELRPEYNETLLRTDEGTGPISEKVSLERVTEQTGEETRITEYTSSSEREIIEKNLLEKHEQTTELHPENYLTELTKNESVEMYLNQPERRDESGQNDNHEGIIFEENRNIIYDEVKNYITRNQNGPVNINDSVQQDIFIKNSTSDIFFTEPGNAGAEGPKEIIRQEIRNEVERVTDAVRSEHKTERIEELSKATEYTKTSEREIIEKNLSEKSEPVKEQYTEYNKTDVTNNDYAELYLNQAEQSEEDRQAVVQTGRIPEEVNTFIHEEVKNVVLQNHDRNLNINNSVQVTDNTVRNISDIFLAVPEAAATGEQKEFVQQEIRTEVQKVTDAVRAEYTSDRLVERTRSAEYTKNSEREIVEGNLLEKTEQTKVLRPEYYDTDITHNDYAELYLNQPEQTGENEQTGAPERKLPAEIQNYIRNELKNDIIQKTGDNINIADVTLQENSTIIGKSDIFLTPAEAGVTDEQPGVLQSELRSEFEKMTDRFSLEHVTDRITEESKKEEYHTSVERAIIERNLLEKPNNGNLSTVINQYEAAEGMKLDYAQGQAETEHEMPGTHSVEEIIRSRVLSEQAAAVLSHQTDAHQSVNFVHKVENREIDEELLNMLQKKTTENHHEETIVNRDMTDSRVIETNNLQQVSHVTNRQIEDIEDIVSRQVRSQMGSISDQVLSRLERRLSDERRRHGY